MAEAGVPGIKSQLTFFTLSRRGFRILIFVNGYRLFTGAAGMPCPAEFLILKDAALFLEKKLGYSPKLILLGSNCRRAFIDAVCLPGESSEKVKAVINIVGPADLSGCRI